MSPLSLQRCQSRVARQGAGHFFMRREVEEMAVAVGSQLSLMSYMPRGIPDLDRRHVELRWKRVLAIIGTPQELATMPFIFRVYLHDSAVMETTLSFVIIMHELIHMPGQWFPMLLLAQTPSLEGALIHAGAGVHYGFFPLRVLREEDILGLGVLHIFEGRVVVDEMQEHALHAEGFNPNLMYIYDKKGRRKLVDTSFIGNGQAPAGARYFNDASGLIDFFSGAALVNKLEMFKDGTVTMVSGMSTMAITSFIPWRRWSIHELFIAYGAGYWERRAELWHVAVAQQ
jgi:hypothetical protein